MSSKIFMADPDELYLIGRDTKDTQEHPLYDERVHEQFDAAFVQSILRKGVLKPILVRKVGEEVQVVDGRRRVINAREANIQRHVEKLELLKVPCMLEKGKDSDLFETMVAANCFQKAPSPIENARMLKRFLAFEGKTEKDAAEVFGVDIKTIGNWQKMDQLDTSVVKAVERDEISATAATKLATLPKKQQKKKLNEAKRQSNGKRVRVAMVAKQAGTKNLAFKAPSKKIVKKLAAHNEEYEVREISQDFIRGARWAIGDVPTEKVKGLKTLLKNL